MKTPEKMTVEQFQEAMEEWLARTCTHVGGGQYICNKCGDQIQAFTARVSLHNADFAELCAGVGRVREIPIPYCPKCEPLPAEKGCLHISQEAIRQEVFA